MENNPGISKDSLEDAIINNGRLKTLSSLYQENTELIMLFKHFEFALACKVIASGRERAKTGESTQFWCC